ncbi:hypothetical protein JKP88DRAFT_304841 [Tribonema minus]|uniref:Calcium-transporting ATPase n=1 Tax=Tribonema minus TaxID=303371 RepID=A0A835ZDK6_9STRA|nr:hypothetical protein JKP88DRAFT_304841 [Tribonema minus]
MQALLERRREELFAEEAAAPPLPERTPRAQHAAASAGSNAQAAALLAAQKQQAAAASAGGAQRLQREDAADAAAAAQADGGGGGVAVEAQPSTVEEVTPDRLFSLVSSAQEVKENKERLDKQFGGTLQLAAGLGVDLITGLSPDQVIRQRERFGNNCFPEPPMKGFFKLFMESFNDTILQVLIVAAVVSLIIGIITEPGHGWIEGTAILIAVFIVAIVTATNDYSKELQFRALEKTSEESERALVLRNGETLQIHPDELVIGDVVLLKAGDSIPADGIIFEGEGVKCNESGLTGEPDDLEKRPDGSNPFLFSSCLVTEVGNSSDAKIVVTGVGTHSEWGKIRATLTSEPSETPLQQKLDVMATLIGYVGVGFAVATFIVLVIMIWARHGGQDILQGFVDAFIIAVTIIVVAIPEGLPLAVTISLAYSTRKMYKDQNLIRVLAACETMGNATNICSDKTGTLTMNQMTVVEGWFGDNHVGPDALRVAGTIPPEVLDLVTHNCAINRSCEVHFKGEDGKQLHKPKVIGSATEGALVILAMDWGFNAVSLKKSLFDPAVDREYPFNSAKKRSSVLVTRKEADARGLRLFCKGASERVLQDCAFFTGPDGKPQPLTDAKRREMEEMIFGMADRALRTICIAHIDFDSVADLPAGWETESPDSDQMVCDAVVGIMDPLRPEVKEAVATAQHAGVMVRMVTGDNIHTAKAIARDCGILREGGVALEGPTFRNMTPAQVDEVLPRLQVLARSTPNDKYLLVTRLNGHNMPKNEAEWKEIHDKTGVLGLSWETDRDRLLPGYAEEWAKANPKGGEVVGVTGDGTNDAPALKAADVGLSMGITGTKVAQNASDIVILDDRFSSIVRAIMWGRSVYDNIRKFLQFQLTVNVVALSIVFIGSVAGFDPPLNAVMMLWVNLIMDTMGALALGTEAPTLDLLKRKPFSRRASLLSYKIMRHIGVMSVFQLAMLLGLLFAPDVLFDDVRKNNPCEQYVVKPNVADLAWSPETFQQVANCAGAACAGLTTCASFTAACGGGDNGACYDDEFAQYADFDDKCFKDCTSFDYVHYSLIFNTFVFAQIANEFNARSIGDEWNILRGIGGNPMFIAIILITIGLQIFVIEVGGEFTKTAGLTAEQWLITSALGLIAFPLGVLMRFIPVGERMSDYAGYDPPGAAITKSKDAVAV